MVFFWLHTDYQTVHANIQMNTEMGATFTTYLLCSYKAALQKATQHLMFLGGGHLLFVDWFIFLNCGWTKFVFSLLHLDHTYTLYCITGSTFTGRQSLGFTTVTNGNLQNYRNTLPGGTPCTDAHTCTHKIRHALIFSCSLHAVPHIRGTKVREHHLMLKDLKNAHCSTFGTVFVATLDNFLLLWGHFFFLVSTFFFTGFHTVFIGSSFLKSYCTDLKTVIAPAS